MVAIMMQGTKARREWRALSLIDSGGWVSIKMSTEQSRIADMSTLWREGGKGSHGPNDGHHSPPVGTS